ncbi:transcription factor BIM2-like [Salvia splendens]|uniref:transcription factor BIM2-like n=1 Tax=Salvia splendens TaxID=180675 RepID=UPI001102DE9F|nr:transcription factor BIM2-like [Salvia splendens]
MKSGKGHQEEEEEEEEEFGAKKDATSSANNSKDGKNSDKANAIRSKHSVTEQRRRSKINERFQILRELIPHSDQKRDTASFLVEVIQYVQFLQEKVQKYEGSYQPWNSEPTKLMPWRNSHWRVQNFVGQPPTAKNGSAPGSAFPGRFDENSLGVPMTMQPGQTNPIEPDHVMDTQVSMGNDGPFSHTFGPSEAQSSECPSTADALNLQDELTIEGGTINVSSIYSEGLLTTLTQALQSTGVDLSQASISVQINLGKRANRGATPTAKDHIIPTPSSNQPVGTFHEATSSEDFDLAQKRRKI